MTVVRRFLIASSLARLVERERDPTSITEGYFAAQHGRSFHVVVEGERCHLVLVTEADGAAPVEDRTELPRSHAEALLDACAGKVSLARSRVALDGGGEALIDRMTRPGVLDTVSIEFDNPDQAAAFAPPAWLGPEITAEPSFGRHMMALNGVPPVNEVPLSNATLEALLDLLEDRVPPAERAPAVAPRPPLDHSLLDALRHLSASAQSAPASQTEPLGSQSGSPEPQMPHIAQVTTPGPALGGQDYEQPHAHAGALPEPSGTPDNVRPEEWPSTGPDRSIKSRLFPRRAH